MDLRRLSVRSPFLLVLLIGVGLGLVLSSSTWGQGADSPEAVFEAAQAAAKAQDWQALFSLVAPSQIPLVAFEADMAVSMMVEFWEGDDAEAAKEKYAKARSDFDVPDDVEGEELVIDNDTPQEEIDAHVTKRAMSLFEDVDTVGYVSTLIGIMLSSPMMEGQSLPFPEGPLAEVSIDGESATGQASERTVSFVQEGGRWYLTADAVK